MKILQPLSYKFIQIKSPFKTSVRQVEFQKKSSVHGMMIGLRWAFPYCPVSIKCLWKKTMVEKKTKYSPDISTRFSIEMSIRTNTLLFISQLLVN